MSFAKLNVWVRTVDCQVVDHWAHLHVYDCHGRPILPPPYYIGFLHGHIEVQVPPGCYILQAGVPFPPHGNYYTDRTMVVVSCGGEACANLIYAKFSLEHPPQSPPEPERPLVLHYCSRAILTPLIERATAAGIKPQELDTAIGVIARAALIDRRVLLDDVKADIGLLEENLEKFEPKEREDVKKYVTSMKAALGSISR